jgi:pyocin large subunit-like protein
MAIEAIAWVLSQEIRPSTAKFVLLGFCNFIQPDSTAWCALSTLSEITSQDKKTVRRGIKTLETLGFIRNTGTKSGQTEQIPLYKINLPDAVFLRLRRKGTKNGTGTKFPRKGYRSSPERVPKTVPDPYMIRNDPNGSIQKLAALPISDHLSKLKNALQK